MAIGMADAPKAKTRLICDLLDEAREANRPAISVEFFPPKTEAGDQTLRESLEQLRSVDLDFVSVTYGAGGSTRDRTRDLVVDINANHPHPAMAHLTCVGHTRSELESLLTDYRAHGVWNILALGGDPPAEAGDTESPAGDFEYALELVEMIRDFAPTEDNGFTKFSIGVAAHPELHPRSTDRALDREHLAAKLVRADFGVTQFFFDVALYTQMMDELSSVPASVTGVAGGGIGSVPVIPGIMPLTNPAGIRRMATMSAASVPEDELAHIEAADEQDRLKIAIEYAAELSQDLLDAGAPGLHIYGLNKADVVVGLLDALR